MLFRSGEIELLRIGIQDPQTGKVVYDDTAMLQTYDDLVIEASIKIDSRVKDFNLFITTFDGQLREVMSSSSRITLEPFQNDIGEVRSFIITIPRMVLASGKYSITFGAVNPLTLNFYCRITNSIFFNMMAVGSSWACSVIPGTWEETSASVTN